MSWHLLMITIYSVIAALVFAAALIIANWSTIQEQAERFRSWLAFRRTKRVLTKSADSMAVKLALNGGIRRRP